MSDKIKLLVNKKPANCEECDFFMSGECRIIGMHNAYLKGESYEQRKRNLYEKICPLLEFGSPSEVLQ